MTNEQTAPTFSTETIIRALAEVGWGLCVVREVNAVPRATFSAVRARDTPSISGEGASVNVAVINAAREVILRDDRAALYIAAHCLDHLFDSEPFQPEHPVNECPNPT